MQNANVNLMTFLSLFYSNWDLYPSPQRNVNNLKKNVDRSNGDWNG